MKSVVLWYEYSVLESNAFFILFWAPHRNLFLVVSAASKVTLSTPLKRAAFSRKQGG